jgi:trimeric autotransporter adhesin
MRKLIIALVLTAVIGLTAVSVAAADPGPIQVSGQSASTSQQAVAASGATQTNPSNTNISIRVLSPGNDGNVTQSNSVGSSATAGNAAGTSQAAGQTAAGGAIQSANQSATTDQVAGALSIASQAGASNVNVPIRVLSEGNDGNVTQSNDVGSRADAANAAGTTQASSQSASGGSCGCSGGTPVQTADQSATTTQAAGAESAATQVDPSNTTVSIRVLSPGDGGSVTQSNSAGSSATAGNLAQTTQTGSQTAAAAPCGCGGTAVQQAKQSAATEQGAAALSGASQVGASNTASPVRVGSDGNDGSVQQSNTAGSTAIAANGSTTGQQASQTAAAGSPIQIASQDASTAQDALAGSLAEQAGASNDASPVRVDSSGNGGSVSQQNAAVSTAAAGNQAATGQSGTQTAAAGCGCGGPGIQVLGQKSGTAQGAIAASEAAQVFGERSPCGCGGASGNIASPVRVGSAGDDGTTSQQNAALSSATAGNGSSTTQSGSQSLAGGGLPIQVLGQQAETEQGALAASLAAQLYPSNAASPVRVISPGGGGSVTQSNLAGSSAGAANTSGTQQDGHQTIAATPCGCGSIPIQVAGQSARTAQLAPAFSAALQAYPANTSSPARVWSGGGGGSVLQGNGATSGAGGLNGALTRQGVMQAS